MTFVFQDSVEMPYQRNFIDDLNNFLNLVEKILPIENKAIELNNQTKIEEDRSDKETSMIDEFGAEFSAYLDNLSNKYAMEPVEKCKDKLMETGTTCMEKQKEQLTIALDDLTRRSKDEISQLSEQIRIELESFLWAGVYHMNKTQLIMGSADKVTGTVTMDINGFSYTYETTYADASLQVKRFMEGMSVPVWSKAGLIHKEDKVKQLDISDYYIKRIYSGEDFQLDMQNKKGTKKVNIKVPDDVKNASLMYVDEEATDITASEPLASQVDFDSISKLVSKLGEYIDNEASIVSKTLTKVEIDEKDAIADNEIFESVKVIASQYGEIVKEIFDHGFTKDEIIIKEVIDDDTRNEIFVTVEEISERLSALGGDGLELKGLLNL